MTTVRGLYTPSPSPSGLDREELAAYLNEELLKIADSLKPQPIYGSMYVPAAITVPISGTDPVEINDGTATFDGWSRSLVEGGMFFPTGGTEHYLAITIPGVYEIAWCLGLSKSAGASTEAHGGVMIDDTAIRLKAESQRTIASNNDTGSMSGHMQIALPVGDEEISLWLTNDQSQNLTAEHGNVIVKRIGDLIT